MKSPPNCRVDGGLIDRSRELRFSFDGKAYSGFEGDTLASALMANNVSIMGRSFKYHRPRGVLSAGSEEPNALVAIGAGNRHEPNLPATRVSLHDGLIAKSQNCWPSLGYDLGAFTRVLSPILTAGFYYKTFMRPKWAWMKYEYIIRQMAGLGVSPKEPDPDIYDKRFLHCDVLIVGAGPAGLSAAKTAAASGARVILCDEDHRTGGSLLGEDVTINSMAGHQWARLLTAELQAMDNVEVLTSTTVFNHSDHNYLVALSENPETDKSRKTLLKIRSKQIIFASGSIELPQLFDGNDLPGVMLAGSVRTYINRYGVKPGKQAVIYTNNDSGYASIPVMIKAGMVVRAVIDNRDSASQEAMKIASDLNIAVLFSHRITRAKGKGRVVSVETQPVDGGNSQAFPCDLVCMAGGWTPTVHLFSQNGGNLVFDDALSTLVADKDSHSAYLAGAVDCQFDLESCLQSGNDAANRALGLSIRSEVTVDRDIPTQTTILTDWAHTASNKKRNKTFVDFHGDVTVADLALAVREGYEHVELAKRYTTTGMGMDQGKTANIHAIGLISEFTGERAQDIGHTTYRAPYTPVTFGAVAGREIHENLAFERHTPFYHCHVNAGAVFDPSSTWRYPKCFPRKDETIGAAIEREIINTRNNVGVTDVSSLGKLEIYGPDAVKFLELAYINKFASIPINKCRYVIMLRHDGPVLDDGVATRLAENHFLLTLTTARTGKALMQLQRILDIDFPDLDVAMAPVSAQWANLAIAGPDARAVLEGLKPDFDVSNDAFAYLEFRAGKIAGLTARVYRVSYSGELAYEINVGARDAQAVWNAVLEAGASYGIMPYGVEALDVLRIEKGHLGIGTEINGKTTPHDLGLGGMVKKDQFFIGSVLLNRPAYTRDDRLQLVGLMPLDRTSPIPAGAQILETKFLGTKADSLGHVTATVYSPTLDQPIALALISGGRARMGEKLFATSPVNKTEVEVIVTSQVFIDPAGERLRV
jgi:sarcosine oxidase subunit alpha